MTLSLTKTIVNLYLYGQSTTPNLLDSDLNRNGGLSSVSIDTKEFMISGAGRFAVGAQFSLIDDFFASTSLTEGTYTKAQLAEELGYGANPFYGWNMQQYDWRDSKNDYADRVFVFNSMGFEISDTARFVVDEFGNKSIQNYYIQPNDQINENFDFNSNDGLAYVLNPGLESTIDPSDLGRVVNINFNNNLPSSTTYTYANYLADENKISGWSGLSVSILADEGRDLLNDLWDSGITRFLDSNNRPIIYGTSGLDNLDASDGGSFWSAIYNISGVSNIESYKDNGVVIFGGNAADNITGGDENDVLYGGYGIDVMNGGEGNDLIYADELYYTDYSSGNILDGGGGSDELVGGGGTDTFIWDYDYDDRIIIWGNGGNDIIQLVDMVVDDLTGKYTKSGHAYVYASGSDSYLYLPNFKNDPGKPVYFKNPDGSLVAITTVFDEEEEPEDDPSGGQPFNPTGRDPFAVAPYMDGVGDGMDDANAAQYPKLDGSPLVIDMDGDGIELTDLATNPVYWDVDNDGFRDASAWVTGGDALLVMDRDGNGTIDNHSELFGTKTTDGFTILSALDSNNDDVINSSDDDFDQLKIWIDANQDGRSQASEMQTLTQADIVSINLNSTPVWYQVAGNDVTHQSTVTMGDTSTKTIVDAWFKYDDMNTIYDGSYVLDIRTRDLPTIRGYGEIKDLHIAMSMDETLLNKVSDLADMDLGEVLDADNNFDGKFREMIYRWGGTEDLDLGMSRVDYDHRKTDFLDELSGRGYRNGVVYGTGVAFYSPSYLTQTWQTALTALEARFLAQTTFKPLFAGDLVFNPESDTFSGVTGLSPTGLATIANLIDASSDKNYSWVLVIRVIDGVFGIDNLTSTDYNLLDTAIQADVSTHDLDDLYTAVKEGIDNTTLGDPYQPNTVYGTGADDLLGGGNQDDVFYGGFGDDRFYGQMGNDTYYGGMGDDYYDDAFFGGGDDTYVYQGGHDAINDGLYGADKIVLADGITVNDITMERVNLDPSKYTLNSQAHLIIHVAGYGDITIQTQYNSGVVTGIETLQFNDLSTINLTTLDNWIYGTGVNDTLTGQDRSYYLRDMLDAGSGNDVLDGGLGNDVLNGGDGDDTYLVGEGIDLIQEFGGNDQIVFDSSYNPNLFTFVFDPLINVYDPASEGLKIYYDGELKAVVDRQFAFGSNYFVEKVVVDGVYEFDLTTMNWGQVGTSAGDSLYAIQANAVQAVVYGMEGNDAIKGSSNADKLYGGSGDDSIQGVDGDDIIYGDDGVDNIEGGFGNDTIHGGAGNDYITDMYSGDDIIYGDDGNDTIYGDYGYAYGSSNDTVNGGSGNDILYGGIGNDNLDGNAGDDTVNGEAGEDTMVYVYGENIGNTDLYYGGTGSDTLKLYFNSSDLTQDIKDSVNAYIAYLANPSNIDVNSSSGAEFIFSELGLTAGRFETVKVYVDGVEKPDGFVANIINGTEGDDIPLVGTSGDDAIFGKGGNDGINAGAGNDTIDGGTGYNTLRGGTGDDTYVLTEANLSGTGNQTYIQEYLGEGTDTLLLSDLLPSDIYTYTDNNADYFIRLKTETTATVISWADTVGGDNEIANYIEHIKFADGTTWNLANGLFLNDSDDSNGYMAGSTANDTIHMNGGNDAAWGGAGNDLITGGNGEDNIYGADGNDTLAGNDGTDYLHGGAGTDVFVFEAATAFNNVDTIGDFTVSDNDKLDLSDLLIGYVPGTSDINDYLSFTADTWNKTLVVDRDGTGSTYSGEEVVIINNGVSQVGTIDDLFNNDQIIV